MTEETRPSLISLLEEHPEIFEAAEDGCEEEELDELEQALGRPVPVELVELLRSSNGGTLHGPQQTVHLASTEDLMAWHEEGAMEELGTFPFAHDGGKTVLVLDSDGEWGGPQGGVYRVHVGLRAIRGFPVQDAFRVADSLSELIGHVVAGKEAW